MFAQSAGASVGEASRGPDAARHPPAAEEAQDDAGCQAQVMLDTANADLEVAASLAAEVARLLEALESRVKSAALTGLPAFVRLVAREQRSLAAVAFELAGPQTSSASPAALGRKLEASSTAVRHASLHWSVLKRSRALVAVHQTFQSSSKAERAAAISQCHAGAVGRDKAALQRALKEQGRVGVHVVDWGREWIDVRPLRQDRLARQMADSGWGWGEHVRGDRVPEDEWSDTPLATHVGRLVAAAKRNRCQYQIPRLRLVLPHVSRRDADVDAFLDQLVRLDPSVAVTVEDRDSRFLAAPPPDLAVAIPRLVGDELERLTPTLNLDHTVLVDLASDITHLRLEPQPWQPSATQAQIVEEQQHGHGGGLMARTLYALLAGRTLVCTREAAQHFHAVLTTVGTESEKQRGALLVPPSPRGARRPPPALRQSFQALSAHPLPDAVRLPVAIVAEPWTLPSLRRAVVAGRLPPVALDVARLSGFTPPKLSVFAYGWAARCVTVTSNREVRGRIGTWLEACRRNVADEGPAIWTVDVTRNLLAKGARPPETMDDSRSASSSSGSTDGATRPAPSQDGCG